MSHRTDADAPPGGRGRRRGACAPARVPAVHGAPSRARGRPRRDRRRAARGPAARRGAPAAPLAGSRSARRERRPGRGCGVVVARRAPRAPGGRGARPRFGMGPGPMMMGPGGMDGPAMMLPLLLRSANLTPEQEAQVQKIMADQRAQTRALVREMRAGQAALLDKLFAAGDPKVDDLKPELDRLTRARQQLMDHAVTTALDIRKVLTPEQLARAAKIKDRMRALHDQMRDLVEPEE